MRVRIRALTDQMFNHQILNPQILNHGVTHTYLMRNISRSAIFTGSASITIIKNSSVAYWIRLIFSYAIAQNFLNAK